MVGMLFKSVRALLFFLISKFDGTESNHARRLPRQRKHKNALFTSESHTTSTSENHSKFTSKSHSRYTSKSQSNSKSTSKSSSSVREWSNMSAKQKKRFIFKKLLSTERESNIFPRDLMAFLAKDLQLMFDHSDDITRPFNDGLRFPHPNGGVCMVELVAAQKNANHNYSGLFMGAPHGVARLSYAAKPRDNTTSPGVAMKLFRDHQLPSANLFARVPSPRGGHFGGNFFASELSNHIPITPPNGPEQLEFARVVNRTTFPSTMVGMSHVAEFGVSGETGNKDFLFELRFEPNDDLTVRFQNIMYNASIMEILSCIEEGTKLYDVYAARDPLCTDHSLVGTLKTTSRFVASSFGDEHLFFQHQEMADDIILKPEWKEFAKNGEGLCPLGF